MENTTLLLAVLQAPRDHLHIRGEYKIAVLQNRASEGSPPHTWRIRIVIGVLGGDAGITSTYVENTDYAYRSDREVEDHLHIRGEYK